MNISLVYVTAPGRDEALRIGQTLVEESLAACANVIDGMTSVFRWNGAVQQEREALLLLKTRSEFVDRAVRRVQELHPYEVPAILVLPVEFASPLFLNWVFEATTAAADQ